jgi:hypothetical protein
MRMRLLRVFSIFAIVSVLISGQKARGDCGPGDHWIDSCPGGQDNLSNCTAIGSVDITLDCETDVSLPGAGLAVVERADPSDDSQNYPGTRPVDGHLDVIDTEILSLSLTGSSFSIVAGEGQGQGGVLPASPGVIAEEPSDPALGESFFDCYFEANIFGTYVYNHEPIRLQATIVRFPPFGQTYTFTGCVPAYDSPTPGQGNLVGNITSIEFTIGEQANVPTLTGWGMMIMGLLLLAAATTAVARRTRVVPGNA